jgi:hypothetical protein
MKKFLALLLILGLSTMANAALSLDVSGGAGNIAIVSDTDFTSADNTNVFIVADAAVNGNTITGGALTAAAPPEPPSGVFGDIGVGFPAALTSINALLGLTDAQGVFGALAETTGTTAAGTYMDSLALSPGNLPDTVYLVESFDFVSYALLDQVTIPEPMTLSLLGLGGLALLRRRR